MSARACALTWKIRFRSYTWEILTTYFLTILSQSNFFIFFYKIKISIFMEVPPLRPHTKIGKKWAKNWPLRKKCIFYFIKKSKKLLWDNIVRNRWLKFLRCNSKRESSRLVCARARAHNWAIFPPKSPNFGPNMVKIEIFQKIVDFGPRTLLMTKNEL